MADLVQLRSALFDLAASPDPRVQEAARLWAAALGAFLKIALEREAQRDDEAVAEAMELFVEGTSRWMELLAEDLEPSVRAPKDPTSFALLRSLERIAQNFPLAVQAPRGSAAELLQLEIEHTSARIAALTAEP
jgi:hypothetical protein